MPDGDRHWSSEWRWKAPIVGGGIRRGNASSLGSEDPKYQSWKQRSQPAPTSAKPMLKPVNLGDEQANTNPMNMHQRCVKA